LRFSFYFIGSFAHSAAQLTASTSAYFDDAQYKSLGNR
jgi:hypothetical protein